MSPELTFGPNNDYDRVPHQSLPAVQSRGLPSTTQQLVQKASIKPIMSSPAKPTASATVTASATAAPPRGVEAGGQWGKNKYSGQWTQAAACFGCLCFCLPGLLILCCPFDERDAYMVNGKIYDAGGQYIGSTGETKFIPARK